MANGRTAQTQAHSEFVARWQAICICDKQLQIVSQTDRGHLKKPMDDRALVSANQTEIPAEILLGES
jgi:hypothetical protein